MASAVNSPALAGAAAEAPRAIQPAPPPITKATTAAAAAIPISEARLAPPLRITLSMASRAGTGSSATAPKRVRMPSACARQAATTAACSGCSDSHRATASRRSAGSSPSTYACSSSSVTGELRLIMFHLRPSFYSAQRGALAVEKSLDLHACTRQTRHHRADRHALHLRDFAVGQALQHHQQERVALVFHQRGERAVDVAPAGFRPGQIRRVVV